MEGGDEEREGGKTEGENRGRERGRGGERQRRGEWRYIGAVSKFMAARSTKQRQGGRRAGRK